MNNSKSVTMGNRRDKETALDVVITSFSVMPKYYSSM